MLDAAISLLSSLVSCPSPSGHEQGTAALIKTFLESQGVKAKLWDNNVVAFPTDFNPKKPTLLLNSHHDTVQPSPSYIRNPYEPVIDKGKLYGLGSNDAGGSVVALCCTFAAFYGMDLPFNIVLAITAEEENGGPQGLRSIIGELKPDMAIVGEPTGMQPAIGERGLLVLDCISRGKAGHAARNEGVNAIYKALADIETLRAMKFEKVSPVLGPIKISVTQIQAGTQHNVVPDECRFVVDMRTTDAYSNEQTLDLISSAVGSHVQARSFRNRASATNPHHPLVKACPGTPFVSGTLSDMACISPVPCVKIGPGESSRSHTADEFIYLSELQSALEVYPQILKNLAESWGELKNA